MKYLVLITFLLLACTAQPDAELFDQEPMPTDIATETVPVEPAALPDWMNTVYTDIHGEAFTLGELDGPVLIKSFAVWCPKCRQQFAIMKEVDVTHVSLNTDPNEDEQQVRDYVTENDFHGRFAVASSEATQQLIDEFGITIINAPSVPVILVCEDKNYRLLGKGVKDKETLQSEIAAGC